MYENIKATDVLYFTMVVHVPTCLEQDKLKGYELLSERIVQFSEQYDVYHIFTKFHLTLLDYIEYLHYIYHCSYETSIYLSEKGKQFISNNEM